MTEEREPKPEDNKPELIESSQESKSDNTHVKDSIPENEHSLQAQTGSYGSGLNLGPDPMQVKCPNCQEVVVTHTEKKPSKFAIILCLVLAFIPGCSCYSCVPFCMDSMKDTEHKCPNCGVLIGVYRT